LQNRIKTYN